MMASYVVEGVMEAAMADDAVGRWLRENVDFLFVPFMDTDGVEDGDQGKNRKPHDHNRDYVEARYKEVAAFKEKLPAWAGGRPLVYFDCHDPALKGDVFETLRLLEPENRFVAGELGKFAEFLERDCQGPIIFPKASIMPFGTGYNKQTEKPPIYSVGWVATFPNILIASSLELAYATAFGFEVNASSAKEFGRDMAVALKSYFSGNPMPGRTPESSPAQP